MRYDKIELFQSTIHQGVNRDNCLEREDLIELHAARNLVVHNAGKVNKIYIKEIADTKYKLGDTLLIDQKYASEALSLIFRVHDSIASVAIDKLKAKDKVLAQKAIKKRSGE